LVLGILWNLWVNHILYFFTQVRLLYSFLTQIYLQLVDLEKKDMKQNFVKFVEKGVWNLTEGAYPYWLHEELRWFSQVWSLVWEYGLYWIGQNQSDLFNLFMLFRAGLVMCESNEVGVKNRFIFEWKKN